MLDDGEGAHTHTHTLGFIRYIFLHHFLDCAYPTADFYFTLLFPVDMTI